MFTLFIEEEEDNDDDNKTIMALGNGGRQESAGKDDGEVVDGNNTMMQILGAGSSRPRAGEWRTDSQNSGIKKLRWRESWECRGESVVRVRGRPKSPRSMSNFALFNSTMF
jgi:hypothetical protein